jgi:RNA polymerase sigma-70 factor (ECF subfamily)
VGVRAEGANVVPRTDFAASTDDADRGGAARFDPDLVARRAIDIGRRTALGVLGGDHATADDVAHDVAIQALRHAGSLRDPAALDAWLHRTAARAALRALRRARRRRAVEEDHVATRHPAAGVEVAVEDLGRLLHGLPDRQRAALTLRYAHDLDDARIAAALGCRVGTVRALLSRGRAAVRTRLEAAPLVATPVPAAPTDVPTPTAGADDA